MSSNGGGECEPKWLPLVDDTTRGAPKLTVATDTNVTGKSNWLPLLDDTTERAPKLMAADTNTADKKAETNAQSPDLITPLLEQEIFAMVGYFKAKYGGKPKKGVNRFFHDKTNLSKSTPESRELVKARLIVKLDSTVRRMKPVVEALEATGGKWMQHEDTRRLGIQLARLSRVEHELLADLKMVIRFEGGVDKVNA